MFVCVFVCVVSCNFSSVYGECLAVCCVYRVCLSCVCVMCVCCFCFPCVLFYAFLVHLSHEFVLFVCLCFLLMGGLSVFLCALSFVCFVVFV